MSGVNGPNGSNGPSVVLPRAAGSIYAKAIELRKTRRTLALIIRAMREILLSAYSFSIQQGSNKTGTFIRLTATLDQQKLPQYLKKQEAALLLPESISSNWFPVSETTLATSANMPEDKQKAMKDICQYMHALLSSLDESIVLPINQTITLRGPMIKEETPLSTLQSSISKDALFAPNESITINSTQPFDASDTIKNILPPKLYVRQGVLATEIIMVGTK